MLEMGGHRAPTLPTALVSKQAALSTPLGKQCLLEGKGRGRRGRDGAMRVGERQAEAKREGGRRGVHSEYSATRAAITG